MSGFDILFYFFSTAMLLSGVLVIANRNPVTSAMFLIVLFFFMSALFVLLEAFFLAAIQILVYAGAIMVLFLFVIMLLDIKPSRRQKLSMISITGGAALAGIFVWELGTILGDPIENSGSIQGNMTGGFPQVLKLLFVKYMLPFEVTGLLLLVAMIGVVLLSKKELK